MRNIWALDVGTCHTSREYKDGRNTTEIKRNQGVAVGNDVSGRRHSRDSHPGPSLENGLPTQPASQRRKPPLHPLHSGANPRSVVLSTSLCFSLFVHNNSHSFSLLPCIRNSKTGKADSRSLGLSTRTQHERNNCSLDKQKLGRMFSNGGTDHCGWRCSSLESLLVTTGFWLPSPGVEGKKEDEEGTLATQASHMSNSFMDMIS